MNKDQIKLKWWFLNNKTSVSVRFKVSLLSHYRITEGWLMVYHLESTPEKQKNLCRIEEYFQDFFFFFRIEVNTQSHSLLKKQQMVHLLSNGNSGARRQTSAVDKFCMQYAPQNGGRIGAFKNSDLFLPHNSLYQSKVCSSCSSASSGNSLLSNRKHYIQTKPHQLWLLNMFTHLKTKQNKRLCT